MARRGTTAHALAACIGEGGAMEQAARDTLSVLVAACGGTVAVAARLGISPRQAQRLLVGLGLRELDTRKANKPARPSRMQRLGCECSACRRVAA